MNIDTPSMPIVFALLMGATIGSVAAYIGSLMITKRMTLMAGALGHLTLPGIALALKYNIDISLGALSILIIGVVAIWMLEKKTHLPIEALTAIVFTSSVATAFLFLPEEKMIPALLGDISHLNWFTAMTTVLLSGLVFFITRYIFTRMILISISPDIAKNCGFLLARDNLVYLSCIALIVALGVRIVGGLMTAALIAIPASTSRNVSVNLAQYSNLSMLFGGLSCICGVFLTILFGIPIGSSIILSSFVFFIISLFFKS